MPSGVGIFGTPLEPLFNNDSCGSNAEILQDWLVRMATSNSMEIKSATTEQNLFTTGGWSECVFYMCEKFELTCQAKYIALEIFDRFMLKHLQDLYKHVQNSNSKTKLTEWRTILERVTNQAFLRILSCCQIASKLSSHYKVITLKRACRCLLDAGYSYSLESILQSELRVLKTLSFNVSRCSSLDFVEVLLEILGHNCYDEELEIKVYHEASIKILNFISLYRQEIYELLYFNTAGAAGVFVSSQEQRSKLAAVKADKMLFAVAVVTTAVQFTDPSLTQKVIMHLHKISEIPVEDIQDFVRVLVQSFLNKTSSNLTYSMENGHLP